MKIRNFLPALALSTLILTSCDKENATEIKDDKAVNFTTGIDTRTTAGGDEWLTTDQVGIYMVATDGTLPGDIVGGATTGADNRKYNPATTGASAALTPTAADQTIYYPQTGNVDFIAYYPWRTTPMVDPYIYKVNVTDQTDQQAIDLLWAKTGDVAKSSAPVAFAFAHKLSKLILDVKAGEGFTAGEISALLATDISIEGMPATADFTLTTGALTAGTAANIQPLQVATGAGADATFSAIVVPQAANSTPGRSVTFTVGGQDYTWNIPDAVALAKGKHHTYTITIAKTGITVSPATITPWIPGTGDTGTAGRLYKVGDYYPDPNVTFNVGVVATGTAPIGVVYWLENPVNGRSAHGKIVSLDEEKTDQGGGRYGVAWGPFPSTTTASNMTDGLSNMAAIAADIVSSNGAWTWSSFPAFNWVHGKNPASTTYASGNKGKWYLPAKNELEPLYTAYNTNRVTFNSYLAGAGGTALESTTWPYYWSSSQDGSGSAWGVDFDGGGTGISYKYDQVRVRGVLAF